MHELDLLLERWMDRDFDGAGAARRQAFVRLLELPDPELAWLLLAGGRSDDPELQGLLEAMRASPEPHRPIPGPG
jgi:succinate dehydrogenase flavin-adding protein (antitoxin of CptAB toxin-antitoxin module)